MPQVRVTDEDHILPAMEGEGTLENCPVARALSDTFDARWCVSTVAEDEDTEGYGWDAETGDYYAFEHEGSLVRLPEKAREVAAAFDRWCKGHGPKPEPTAFYLDPEGGD